MKLGLAFGDFSWPVPVSQLGTTIVAPRGPWTAAMIDAVASVMPEVRALGG
jgi:hypothetical protein